MLIKDQNFLHFQELKVANEQFFLIIKLKDSNEPNFIIFLIIQMFLALLIILIQLILGNLQLIYIFLQE